MHIHAYIDTYVGIHTYIPVKLHVYIYVYTPMFIHIYVYVHVCLHAYVYVDIFQIHMYSAHEADPTSTYTDPALPLLGCLEVPSPSSIALPLPQRCNPCIAVQSQIPQIYLNMRLVIVQV